MTVFKVAHLEILISYQCCFARRMILNSNTVTRGNTCSFKLLNHTFHYDIFKYTFIFFLIVFNHSILCIFPWAMSLLMK